MSCHIIAIVVGGCEQLVMVVGSGGVVLWTLWPSEFVSGLCHTLPFIVRCHVSPVSYVKKERERGGGLLLTSAVSVDYHSLFVVIIVHLLQVALLLTVTWRLLLV